MARAESGAPAVTGATRSAPAARRAAGEAAPLGEPPQVRRYRLAIKKKEAMRALLRLLPPLGQTRCLELGGTLSAGWLLRERGGRWVCAETGLAEARASARLPGYAVHLADPLALPFADGIFDVAVGVHYVRHLEDDVRGLAEVARVLAPGGHALLTSPEADPRRLGYRLRRLYGFTVDTGYPEDRRDGYTRAELAALVNGAGLEVERIESYSRLFTETLENTLQYVYAGAAARVAGGMGETPEEAWRMSDGWLESTGWAYRAFKAAYPLLRGVSLLDRLIPFSDGYMFCVRARKPGARTPRR